MSNNKCLQHLPISLFASVMGLTGLSIAYQRFAQYFAPAYTVGILLLFFAALVFFAISIAYFAKLLYFKKDVLSELNHPIRSNFFAAISISLLLLSIGTIEINRNVSNILWISGSFMQLCFSLFIISRWITKNYEIAHSNPTWFIPVVGNILVPIAGVEFANREFSWFFFSTGLFFWLSLFTIVFYRIIFHHQLPEKFIPTLFILIAPPAVGFVSYVKLTGEMDGAARILLYVALFFVMLLAAMAKHFLQLRFFVSWWAYTFPICAVTIATILASKLLQSSMLVALASSLLIISSIIIIYVSAKTANALYRKKLCEPEE